MLKVNSKDTRRMSITIHIFSSVFIIDFEQVNVCWDFDAVFYFQHEAIIPTGVHVRNFLLKNLLNSACL